jgi:hypothetical protein
VCVCVCVCGFHCGAGREKPRVLRTGPGSIDMTFHGQWQKNLSKLLDTSFFLWGANRMVLYILGGISWLRVCQPCLREGSCALRGFECNFPP